MECNAICLGMRWHAMEWICVYMRVCSVFNVCYVMLCLACYDFIGMHNLATITHAHCVEHVHYR